MLYTSGATDFSSTARILSIISQSTYSFHFYTYVQSLCSYITLLFILPCCFLITTISAHRHESTAVSVALFLLFPSAVGPPPLRLNLLALTAVNGTGTHTERSRAGICALLCYDWPFAPSLRYLTVKHVQVPPQIVPKALPRSQQLTWTRAMPVVLSPPRSDADR